jgi:hypothetical protein
VARLWDDCDAAAPGDKCSRPERYAFKVGPASTRDGGRRFQERTPRRRDDRLAPTVDKHLRSARLRFGGCDQAGRALVRAHREGDNHLSGSGLFTLKRQRDQHQAVAHTDPRPVEVDDDLGVRLTPDDAARLPRRNDGGANQVLETLVPNLHRGRDPSGRQPLGRRALGADPAHRPEEDAAELLSRLL